MRLKYAWKSSQHSDGFFSFEEACSIHLQGFGDNGGQLEDLKARLQMQEDFLIKLAALTLKQGVVVEDLLPGWEVVK